MVEKSCSYNEYFNQVDKDGLGPTDAIIRESKLIHSLSLGGLLHKFSSYTTAEKVKFKNLKT